MTLDPVKGLQISISENSTRASWYTFIELSYRFVHYFEKALRKVIDTLVHCSAYVQVTIKASERGVFSWSISFPCDIFF